MTRVEKILRGIIRHNGLCVDLDVVCSKCPIDKCHGCEHQCEQDHVEAEAKKLLAKIVEKKALDRVIQKMLERVKP